MYEKLDKLRADLEKARQRRADAEVKVKQAEQRLKEAENTQILSDVGALNLTPEQLAQFLQMAASGQLSGVGTAPFPTVSKEMSPKDEKESYECDEESEDFEDEEN